ncbi:Phenazine biosynthesis protein PhzD [Usitatibacter rugosus]|uniref:Phenazine biosynthesis protein PhzD n=1 Tax=Usitatibacter rugosus TaxID=2732067 RepID=A0A6M4GUI4_9PROT|nr:cysteine hydrolase [Usitatibacter rugosus]QJR09257.1 Phenazine biosynthesis protein PhzD [Usitatibacter rugosus]
MNPVFVFVDLLEDFFANPPLSEQRGALSAAVNELASFARENAFPVIWVRQEFEPDLSDAFRSMRETGTRITIRGTTGCDLIKEIERRPSDVEIVKKRYSAFFGTQLAQRLESARCSQLIIGGVNSHACVRATAIDAFQMDYDVILATDSIASYDDEYHRESMRYLAQSIGRLMSNGDIRKSLHHPARTA